MSTMACAFMCARVWMCMYTETQKRGGPQQSTCLSGRQALAKWSSLPNKCCQREWNDRKKSKALGGQLPIYSQHKYTDNFKRYSVSFFSVNLSLQTNRKEKQRFTYEEPMSSNWGWEQGQGQGECPGVGLMPHWAQSSRSGSGTTTQRQTHCSWWLSHPNHPLSSVVIFPIYLGLLISSQSEVKGVGNEGRVWFRPGRKQSCGDLRVKVTATPDSKETRDSVRLPVEQQWQPPMDEQGSGGRQLVT